VRWEGILGGVDIVKSLNLIGHIIPRIVDDVRTKWVSIVVVVELIARPFLSLGWGDGGVYEVQVFSAVCHLYRHILYIRGCFSGTCMTRYEVRLMGSCWRGG
jgi:hypothetical protein